MPLLAYTLQKGATMPRQIRYIPEEVALPHQVGVLEEVDIVDPCTGEVLYQDGDDIVKRGNLERDAEPPTPVVEAPKANLRLLVNTAEDHLERAWRARFGKKVRVTKSVYWSETSAHGTFQVTVPIGGRWWTFGRFIPIHRIEFFLSEQGLEGDVQVWSSLDGHEASVIIPFAF